MKKNLDIISVVSSDSSSENGELEKTPKITYEVRKRNRSDPRFSSFSISFHPTELRSVERPTTDIETLIHLLKGNIGSGSLALGEAFMSSGLWVGLVCTPLVGLLCAHCMHLILQCSRRLCRVTKEGALDYEQTGMLAFRHGPKVFQTWSTPFFYTITTFLVLTQLGFCCVYFVFVSQNVYQAVECITGGTNITQFQYMLITLAPVMLICFIPDLKYLAPVSMVASFTQLVALIITFYYLLRDLPEVEMKVPAFGGWSEFPLYLGTALYAFEGIGLVLPLENNMKHPNHFPGLTGVLNTGMMLVICIYSSIGFFSYLRYGDTILGSVTLNLPGNEVAAQIVKLMMAAAIFLTYPLQYYVPLSILLPSVLGKFSSKPAKFIAEYGFRSFLVLITFLMAALIPNIGLFTNLIGALCSSALALVFPPFIDILVTWPECGRYNWKLYKNIFIMGVGIFGFVTGTYTSVRAIVDFLEEGEQAITTGC